LSSLDNNKKYDFIFFLRHQQVEQNKETIEVFSSFVIRNTLTKIQIKQRRGKKITFFFSFDGDGSK
jgi:hypothetical protein